MLIDFAHLKPNHWGNFTTCIQNGNEYVVSFHIVIKCANTLLRLTDCVGLNYIKLLEDVYEVNASATNTLPKGMLAEYNRLLEKIGTLPVKHKNNCQWICRASYETSTICTNSSKKKAKEELNRVDERSIIAPVTEPPQWLSALVVTRKKNTDLICICIDPGDKNWAIKRPHHNIIAQIANEIAKGRYFTVIDAKEAFYHMNPKEKLSYHIPNTVWTVLVLSNANGTFFTSRCIPKINHAIL